MQITKEQVLRVQSSNEWEFANSILYRMCEENPLHDDARVIVGKIWLIGRSYAAAIERRKTKDEKQEDNFYFDVVAPVMLQYGDELDKRIALLSQECKLTLQNIKQVVSLHKFVVDIFQRMSGNGKRSLASKYLHFHLPRLFYIYDSRANSSSRKLVKAKKAELLCFLENELYDEEYVVFLSRVIQINDFVKAHHGIDLTPRELDALLLNY